jgi:1-acyl-sn-glycerol-3-phosphate acyltransferase
VLVTTWATPQDEPVFKTVGWFFVNVLQLVWLVAYTVFMFPYAMLLYAMTWSAEPAIGLARTLYGPVNLTFGFSRFVVSGRENFPVGTPYLIMMNHQSMADVLFAWMACPQAVRFIGKRILLFVPIVNLTMWAFGMVAIDRRNVKTAMRSLKKAARILKHKKRILLCFPEGTRTTDGAIGPFKKGVFVLAMKAGVPIVPVAVEGAAVFVPRSGWRPRPVVVRVNVGKPISTTGITDDDRDALMRRVRDEMIDLHLAIGGKGGDRATAIAGSVGRRSSHQAVQALIEPDPDSAR